MGLSPDGQNYSFFSTKICLLSVKSKVKNKDCGVWKFVRLQRYIFPFVKESVKIFRLNGIKTIDLCDTRAHLG